MSNIIDTYKLFPSGGAGATTFNPSDFNAAFTLSNNNLTAVRTGADGWVSGRANTGHTSGKWYFEVLLGGVGSDAGLMVGLADLAASLSTYVGGDANGWGYNSNAGDKYSNSVQSGYGAAFGGGDLIAVAFDVATGKLWFAKNNVWQNSGDPAAGTNPAFTLGAGTNLFPMISGYFGAGAHNFTAHFRAADLVHTPPTGFSAWGV